MSFPSISSNALSIYWPNQFSFMENKILQSVILSLSKAINHLTHNTL